MDKFSYEYPRPMVTATVVLIYDDKIILGKRSENVNAYPGEWCLPGGFLDAKRDDFSGERIEETAVREVKEETNLDISEDDLILIPKVFSDPNIDPRGHVVNICYKVFINDISNIKAADDIQELGLFDLREIKTLAFNHYDILMAAL